MTRDNRDRNLDFLDGSRHEPDESGDNRDGSEDDRDRNLDFLDGSRREPDE